jgi:hypothetical protein
MRLFIAFLLTQHPLNFISPESSPLPSSPTEPIEDPDDEEEEDDILENGMIVIPDDHLDD